MVRLAQGGSCGWPGGQTGWDRAWQGPCTLGRVGTWVVQVGGGGLSLLPLLGLWGSTVREHSRPEDSDWLPSLGPQQSPNRQHPEFPQEPGHCPLEVCLHACTCS